MKGNNIIIPGLESTEDSAYSAVFLGLRGWLQFRWDRLYLLPRQIIIDGIRSQCGQPISGAGYYKQTL